MTTPRSFSPLCKRHRRRRDRAGHPEQLQLTLAALRPYILLIEDTHERNLDSPLWSHLLARYQALVGLAREHSVGTYPGRSRTPPRAADIILKVSQPRSGAQVADPAEVIRHQLAAHLMRYQRPGLFRNDAAFRYALVKRWRYFAPASKGSKYSHRTGKVSGWYQDLPPKVRALAGDWLVSAFGLPGAMVAEQITRQQQAEVQKRQDDREAMCEAIEALQ